MSFSTQGFDEAFFAASAQSWRRGLAAREFSAAELLEAVWERILWRNPRLNAIVATDIEAAREAARHADARLAQGVARPLEGLPLTIKDSFETAGLTTACGMPSLADHVPGEDSVAVARLRAAGAIILGKTNVPMLTGDFQTYNGVYGVSANPWDEALTPGGSSGGAAAAVAVGMTAFELGSDLGGSIRWPSHACGLFGLKTSWGQVPLFGHIPPLPAMRSKNPPDLGVAGPMARSAADLDLALSAMAGPINPKGPAFLRKAATRLPDQLRLAVWLDDDFAPVDASVSAAVLVAAEALRSAGAQVDMVARPAVDFIGIFEAYASLNFAMGAAGLPVEARNELAATARLFDPGDRSYLAIQARAARLDAASFSALMQLRAAVKAAFAAFFGDYDAILCPPAPAPAIAHDFSPDFFARRIATSHGPLPYFDFLKWASLASFAHLPAAVAPVMLNAQGLPCGVQIICAFDEDRSAIAIAGMLETFCGGFRAPPAP